MNLSQDDIEYPRNLFHELISGNSPYAFYLFQWVPYQTDARRWRLKMQHDVKTFDGREVYGIWPNGSHCGPFKDEEVEFIRISRKQLGYEYADPRDTKTKPLTGRKGGLAMSTEKIEPVAAINRKFLRPEWIGPASHWDATAQVVGLDCVCAALRAAVAAERERCAKVAVQVTSPFGEHSEQALVGKGVAAAIRQLGDEQ